MNLISCCAGALTALSINSLAFGHAGPRIWLGIKAGKVVTYRGPYPADGRRADYVPAQVFPMLLPMGLDDTPLNFQTQFPGYQSYPWAGLAAGTNFSYNIVGEVQWYNATLHVFMPVSKAFRSQTPFLAVTNGIGQTQFSGKGFVVGDRAFSFSGSASDHAHLTYTICTPEDLANGFDPEDAPAGVYALPLQFASDRAVRPSDTFYILFGDNVSQTVLDGAALAASSTLVPPGLPGGPDMAAETVAEVRVVTAAVPEPVSGSLVAAAFVSWSAGRNRRKHSQK